MLLIRACNYSQVLHLFVLSAVFIPFCSPPPLQCSAVTQHESVMCHNDSYYFHLIRGTSVQHWLEMTGEDTNGKPVPLDQWEQPALWWSMLNTAHQWRATATPCSIWEQPAVTVQFTHIYTAVKKTSGCHALDLYVQVKPLTLDKHNYEKYFRKLKKNYLLVIISNCEQF